MDILRRSLALVALTATAPAPAAGPFTLASRSMADGGVMTVAQAGNRPNPNCPGRNVSPELHWSNVPAGTQSLAFLMTDPEGRNGLGVTHWIAYGVPPDRTAFAEGMASAPPQGFVGGSSTLHLDIYSGPCPPPDTGWHHYTFLAIATDLPPDALPAGLTREQLLARLEGHARGAAALVVRFRHP